MQKAIQRNGPSKPVHFYCSSGGNAGLGCATAAVSLEQPATIVVPLTTSKLMIEKIEMLGVQVVQIGAHWLEADKYLREELLAKDANGIYVPPFDHEDIWEGNGTLIDELEQQMLDKNGYDAVICSVGGGGLFCGIMDGLDRHERLEGGRGKSVTVLAMETDGADSLSQSLKKGELVKLPAITSIASSLGAALVAKKTFDWAQRSEVISLVLSDAEAAMACVRFADDQRVLVETACGVSIAPAYNSILPKLLFPNLSPSEFAMKNVVIVVCGGSGITLSILDSYREKYGSAP